MDNNGPQFTAATATNWQYWSCLQLPAGLVLVVILAVTAAGLVIEGVEFSTGLPLLGQAGAGALGVLPHLHLGTDLLTETRAQSAPGQHHRDLPGELGGGDTAVLTVVTTSATLHHSQVSRTHLGIFGKIMEHGRGI